MRRRSFRADRFWLAVLALLIVGVAPASAAPRARSFHYFGVGHGPLVGDGSHELALLSTRDALQVFIYRSGIAHISQLSVPRCADEVAPPGLTIPATLGALHADTVAWTCILPANLLLQDVPTGRVTGLLGPDGYVDASGGPDVFAATALGSRWAAVVASGYHYTAEPSYVNLQTRKRAFIPDPHRYADLNDPTLSRRLCAPLARSENTDDSYGDMPSVQPYFYEPPFGATIVLGPRHDTLVLEHCGSHRKQVLDRCPGSCSNVQLSAGVLTWLSGKRVRAYVPRTRRFYAWRPPATADQTSYLSVLHLNNRLLVSVAPHPGGSDWTYWFSPLLKKS